MIEYFTKLIGECPSYLYGVVYVLSFFLVVFGLYVILTLIKVFFSPFLRVSEVMIYALVCDCYGSDFRS